MYHLCGEKTKALTALRLRYARTSRFSLSLAHLKDVFMRKPDFSTYIEMKISLCICAVPLSFAVKTINILASPFLHVLCLLA